MVSRDSREAQLAFSQGSVAGTPPVPRPAALRGVASRGSPQNREASPDDESGLDGSRTGRASFRGHHGHDFQPSGIMRGFARSNFCTLRGAACAGSCCASGGGLAQHALVEAETLVCAPDNAQVRDGRERELAIRRQHVDVRAMALAARIAHDAAVAPIAARVAL